MKGLGQSKIKGDNKNCFLFYGLFSLKRLSEFVMDAVDDMISVVKTNTNSFLSITFWSRALQAR